MIKSDLISIINEMASDKLIVFAEILDTGQRNMRTMNCSKETNIEILNTYFDDNLHGHVEDGIMTTIVSYQLR